MPAMTTINVPATTANLGPGFDCLALALDLWNRVTFSLEGQGVRIKIKGEGNGLLPTDERNLVARSALRLFQALGVPAPLGLSISCENRIPLAGGMGSSAAAIVAGLLGANALMGDKASPEELLRLASALEGHPDNVAAALSGGLALVTTIGEGALARRLTVQGGLQVVVAVPAIHLPTQAARAALPREVPMSDAVFNIGRTAFVIEALRSGDCALLGKMMDDRLHQPYRLKLIPGGEAVFSAARKAGAVSVALSGAGPSVVAFTPPGMDAAGSAAMGEAMTQAFAQAGIQARALVLSLSERGAYAGE